MSAALRAACSEGGRRGGWSRDPRKRERKSPGGAHGPGGGFFVPVVGGVAAFRVWRVLSNGAVGTAGRPGKPVRLTEFSVSRTGKTDSRTGPPVVCDRTRGMPVRPCRDAVARASRQARRGVSPIRESWQNVRRGSGYRRRGGGSVPCRGGCGRRPHGGRGCKPAYGAGCRGCPSLRGSAGCG